MSICKQLKIVGVLAIRVTNMTANISARATDCYLRIGQHHVNWER